MITYKLHQSGEDFILAACDTELVGKTLVTEDGADVFINPSFYQEEEISAEDLLELVKDATIVNLFGEETLKAVEILDLKIILVSGVPHSQIIKMI